MKQKEELEEEKGNDELLSGKGLGGQEKGLWDDKTRGGKASIRAPDPLSDSPWVSPEDGPRRPRTCWVFPSSASPDKEQARGSAFPNKGQAQGRLCGFSLGSQAEVGAGPS